MASASASRRVSSTSCLVVEVHCTVVTAPSSNVTTPTAEEGATTASRRALLEVACGRPVVERLRWRPDATPMPRRPCAIFQFSALHDAALASLAPP